MNPYLNYLNLKVAADALKSIGVSTAIDKTRRPFKDLQYYFSALPYVREIKINWVIQLQQQQRKNTWPFDLDSQEECHCWHRTAAKRSFGGFFTRTCGGTSGIVGASRASQLSVVVNSRDVELTWQHASLTCTQCVKDYGMPNKCTKLLGKSF